MLRDKEYLDQVNTEIQNATEEYAADHYDRCTLHNIPKSKIELSIPDKLFLFFRCKTIAYASMKTKKTQEKEHNLKKSIKEIETKEEKTEEDIKFLQEKN